MEALKEKKSQEPDSKRKKFKVPHSYVIIIMLLIVVSTLTYVIPAGVYDRVEDVATGKQIVNPEVFNYIEKTPVSVFEIPTKIFEGMMSRSEIIFALLIIGGAFEVLLATGMFHAFTSKLTKKFEGREKLLIPGFILIFGILGISLSTNKFIGFAPIGALIAVAMGFDEIVGVAMILLGVGVGFSTGILAPTTAVAQQIAGLPAYSGIGLRIAAFVIYLIVTSWYIVKYAMKIKDDPTKSYVYDLDLSHHQQGSLDDQPQVEKKHFLVLAIVLASFGVLMYGCINYGWGLKENGILFMWMGVVGGLIYGYTPSNIATLFIKGAKGLLSASLIVGLGSAVAIILKDANILDTVVKGLAAMLGHLPTVLRAPAMIIIQDIVNVFVTSGTGQATITMPIMVPLADVSGVSRQTAVLAYKMGDGFTNYVLPHASALMGFLGATGVPYDRWMKFMWKLFMIWMGIGMAILMLASVIGYS